ncbi:MAG TPA: hypothetical protein VF668_10935 [Pyrinomonadaceae bacterium]|jgi:hypothetical protein
MGDWIGLGVFVLVVSGALFGLSRLGRRPEPLTAEEYERRVAEAKGAARSMAAAGLGGLDKFVNPRAAQAIEVQRDLKAGFYDDEEKEGEGAEPGRRPAGARRPGARETVRTDEEGNDA